MSGKIKNIINKSSEHFFYVGSTIISAGIHFLYSVYVKQIIEPQEYGIYSACLLLQTYMVYVQLGSLNAFNRDYPQLVGAGNNEKAKQYRDTTFSYLISVFCISTVIVSIVILSISSFLDSRYTIGLILCAVITTVTVFENYLASRVRIDGSFKFTSFVIVAESLSVCLGFLLISKIGYYGLYFVTIGSMIIGILLYFKKGISDFSFSIDKKLLKTIIISGIPLLINNLIWTIVNSIDKFVILGFINTEALGVYSLAQMAFSYMVLIPSAMSQLFYVKLGKVYGATKSNEDLNNTAMKYTLIIAVIVSFITIVAYYFIGPVVNLIMPKYSDGIKSAQILILGLAIYSPTMVNGNILTILKKNAALLRGSIYLCIFNTICSVGLVVLLGPTLENVALGTSISYFLRTIVLSYQLKKFANVSVLKMIKSSLVPVAIISGPGIVLFHLFDNWIMGFVISFCIACVVVLFTYRKNIINFLRTK